MTLITTDVTAEPEHAIKATYEQRNLIQPKPDQPEIHLKLKKRIPIDRDQGLSTHFDHGTEKEIGSPKESYSAINTLGSLLFVLTLFGCIAYWMRRGGTRNNQTLSSESWEILGRGNLGAKHNVQLVRLGNRVLLLGYSPNTIQTLVEITDPAEVELMVNSCQTKRSQFNGGLSKKIITALTGRSDHTFDQIEHNANPAYVEPKDA
jgi:flagellar biogenesis protein FliO